MKGGNKIKKSTLEFKDHNFSLIYVNNRGQSRHIALKIVFLQVSGTMLFKKISHLNSRHTVGERITNFRAAEPNRTKPPSPGPTRSLRSPSLTCQGTWSLPSLWPAAAAWPAKIRFKSGLLRGGRRARWRLLPSLPRCILRPRLPSGEALRGQRLLRQPHLMDLTRNN